MAPPDFAKGKILSALADDYDYWRESRAFHRNLGLEDEELPDVTPAGYDPFAERAPRLGSMWRTRPHSNPSEWEEAA